MKPLGMLTCLLAVICMSTQAVAQSDETAPMRGYGYALFAPGATLGDGAAGNLTLGAGAEGFIKGGFGAGADLSYLFYPQAGFAQGFGLFSPGVFYQFNLGRKTVPFLTGGYSLAFRDGTVNLIHYGGSLNHWFDNNWGMRFEVRSHTQTRSVEYHLLQFRMALLFR